MLSKLLPKSEFSKNVSTLVAGTGIAQALTLLAGPLLTRIYLPEEYAVFSIFTAISAIIGVVAAARFEMAVVLPAHDSQGKSLVRSALNIVFGVTLATLIGTTVYHFWKYETSSEFSLWFYLLPVSILSVGIFAVCNYWSTRIKTFKMNSYARVIMATITVIVSVLAGYLGMGYRGLIIGYVAGQISGAILLFANYLKTSLHIALPDPEQRKDLLKKHKDFAIVNSPHALIDSLQDNGVIFVLTNYFTQSVVGFYSFAFRILKAPVGLIGAAFSQVFYQRLSEAYNKGEKLSSHILSIYKLLFLIGLPGFLILFLFTPEIFGFVFGDNWTGAGEIARVLIPWLFINFIASPVASVTLIFQKQKQAFLITTLDISLRFGALLIGGIRADYMLGITLMGASCFLLSIFTMWWFYSLAANHNAKA